MRTSYSKKHKAAISVLSGLTAALLLLTGCSKSEETVYQIPEDRKLIVYTAHKADVYEPIIKEFEERTGIFVELKAGDTLALFDELQQDAPGTFDVMFGGGVENFEECRDYLEPYKVSEIDQIAEQYRTEGDAYYILENEVQKMYGQYDRMRRLQQTAAGSKIEKPER